MVLAQLVTDKRAGNIGHIADHNEMSRRLRNSADFASIQGAINEQSTTYIPEGQYVLDTSVLLTRDNLTLVGAGIGKTILDFSACENVNAGGYTNPGHCYGAVTIDSLVNGSPLKNITIKDMTIKTSVVARGAGFHPVLVGAVDNCITENIEVDGSIGEAIYHEDNRGKLSRRWVVRGCQISNHQMSAINSNDPELRDALITQNYIRDGANGIVMVGLGGQIINNVLERITDYGILVLCESPYSGVFLEDYIIAGNVIRDTGIGNTNRPRYGITAVLSGEDMGLIVSNNIISNMHEVAGMPCYAIRSSGNMTISNNLIRGAIGQAGESVGIAIAAGSKDNVSNSSIVGNRVESSASATRYTWGILISNEVLSDGAHLVGNHVAVGAITDTGYSFRDERGKSNCIGNVFGAQYIYGGQTLPAGIK